MLNFLKPTFSLLLFLFLSHIGRCQEIFISNTQNRTFTSLNGKWKYVLDPYETGQMGGMPVYKNAVAKEKEDRVEYSFDDAQTLWVPGSWNYQKTELKYFEGNIWYRKNFDMEGISSDKRYFVDFGGANYFTTVTLNGKIIGKHDGGFTPFAYEVTDLLKEKGNYLVVGVNNSRKADNVPSKVTDWFNHGGIIRDVKLLELPSTFISKSFISLDKESLRSKSKQIKGEVYLTGQDLPEEARIIIPELDVDEVFPVDGDGVGMFSVSSKKLELWSPENPKLYEVIVKAGEDELKDQIGFRVIDTQGKEILLNGEPIFLRGICLHDENPFRQDRANTIEDAEMVLGWAKELECNFLRLAHYPHQENIIRLADKMGILLWEELPLYWGIDWNNPQVLEKAKSQFTELINRDYNRASSIIWSIANETAPTEARNEFLIELAEHVRSIDNTRLVSAACKKDQETDGHPDSVYTYNDPIMEYLDVISFNEYLGWYGGLPEECRKKSFKAGMDKPIIVSEFGGGAIEGFYADSLTRWSEDYQEYLYKESIAMFDKIDGLAGMTPWILVDFMSPLRQLSGVQDGWNRKGLISEKGRKKKAFYILQRYYQRKGSDGHK